MQIHIVFNIIINCAYQKTPLNKDKDYLRTQISKSDKVN